MYRSEELRTDRIVGRVKLTCYGPDGGVKWERIHDNLIVTAGKGHLAARLVGTAQPAMGWMALGQGNASAIAGDTQLGHELGRVALTSYVAAANVVTAKATFPAGTATGTLTEAALLNAVTVGVMFNRIVFSGAIKGDADALAVEWTITIN
jgi:hypothetical protein